MKIDVHILATCLNDALMESTLLVFKTLRTGFPESHVKVWDNALTPEQSVRLKVAADSGCEILSFTNRIAHDAWIERLLSVSTAPFWLCDTDMVFFGKLDQPKSEDFLLGRYEPAFLEPWTKTNRVSRLHTCLLYCDPIAIRWKVKEWAEKWHPRGFPFMPQFDFIRQHFVPQGVGKAPLFYDTCSGLYQAIGGTAFTDEQNSAFEHLHCGTYSDRIEKVLPELARARDAVFSDISNARRLFASQSEYYRNHPANMVSVN